MLVSPRCPHGPVRGCSTLVSLLVVLTVVAACSNGGGSSPPPATGPSNDAALPVPAPEDGFQLTITNHDVPIGGETEICELFVLDNEEPLEIGGVEVKQPLGSHHFVVYSYEGTGADQYPEGQFEASGCTGVGPPDSMNLVQVGGAGDDYESIQYPPGTGIRLRPRQPLLLNSHYTNATGQPFSPTVYVNLYYAKQKIQNTLEASTIANYSIFVPPRRTATTTARWTVPFDLYYILLSSHEHKRGRKFTARIVEGEVDRPHGDRVGRSYGDDSRPEGSTPEPGDFYRSEDWEHPTVLTYDEPRLFRKGTVIEFSCTQENEKETPVTFGPLAEDEMCMLTGIYYRAQSAPPIGARVPGCLPQDQQLICSADPVTENVPTVCGDGRKGATEECDLGAGNGSGGCREDCTLELATNAPLGAHPFPIAFSGPAAGTTDFLNSITNGSSVDGAQGIVADGALELVAGIPDASGVATLSQTKTVTIGFPLLGNSGSFCVRLYPSENTGSLRCRGGATGSNIRATIDNASGTALPTDVQVELGLGTSGPGAASLLINSSLVQVAGGAEECLTRDWSADAVNPIPFTTGNVTGRIDNANGRPGTSIVMSRDGEGFDCSRWGEAEAPGILYAMPLVAPNAAPGFGDVVSLLSLASRERVDAEPEPEPEPTPGGGPTPIGGELLAIRDEVFALRCAQTSCHSDATRAGGLVLNGDDVYDQLVGVAAQNPAAREAGALRVVPGAPEASFLVRKLTGDLAPDEGVSMPFGGAPIPTEEIERIRAWIADGAPPE
jgi:hypothetical protein